MSSTPIILSSLHNYNSNMTQVQLTEKLELLKKCYKRARSSFIKFVQHYNAIKGELNLDPNEKEALVKLHELWKNANENTMDEDIGYFFRMKDLHTELNGKFLYTDEVYKTYIHTTQMFRSQLGSLALNMKEEISTELGFEVVPGGSYTFNNNKSNVSS